MELSEANLSRYLTGLFGQRVKIRSIRCLTNGQGKKLDNLKGFGYGFPYLIEFVADGEAKRVVLETMRTEGFGHDHFSDRAQILLWQHAAFNKLPRHVQALDVGAFSSDNQSLKSLGKCGEFFIITDYVDGTLYHLDLDRIKKTDKINELDKKRCLALSDYLVEIHKVKCDVPGLYTRRMRELVGHGECIMGLLDSYPQGGDSISESYLIDIEQACVAWRWRLKHNAKRLSQVHGDFHPWNIMFHEHDDFSVLDRSRGEWGEPADDVAALTINYIFYSLQKYGDLNGTFDLLYRLFWDNYLSKTGDHNILEVIQPFYAWRGLVVASPIWYPKLAKDVRHKLLNFVKNVLDDEKFNLESANSYFKT